MSKRRIAFDCFDVGCTVAEVAREIGNWDMASNYYWQWRNLEAYTKRQAERDLKARRKRGVRPKAEDSAARLELAQRLAAPVIKSHRKGASFSEVGAALGITRNAVAGRIYRARQRQKAAQEASPCA